MINLEEYSVEELKKGYVKNNNKYVCLLCGRSYEQGEVYQISDRFFEAEKAAEVHVSEHNYAESLINLESKYNTLTENQKKLLQLFASGLSDADIAKKAGISVSTVRHQRFTFREKSKQAKIFLAQFEVATNHRQDTVSTSLPIHNNAKMVDERYMVSNQEREQILKASLVSLNPLKLKHFPRKEKKKVVILVEVAKQFEKDKRYNEKEVNEILAAIFDDYVTLRRYLIDYGFLTRNTDGSEYWKS